MHGEKPGDVATRTVYLYMYNSKLKISFLYVFIINTRFVKGEILSHVWE